MIRRAAAFRVLPLFALLALIPPAGAAPKPAEKPIWLAVGPPELTAPLKPLADLRMRQGFDIRVLPGPVADALKKVPRPRYILLVGDDGPGTKGKPFHLAAPRRKLYRWHLGQAKTFASDASLGDRNGDGFPDVPVGRIPARTPKEVATVVAKILAYEKAAPAPKDLRLVVWGCTTGYGATYDSMETGLLTGTVRRFAPSWADRFLISSVKGNPLCGWPPDEPAVFDRKLREGAVLGAILAHGSVRSIVGMQFQKRLIGYDVAQVKKDFAAGGPVSPAIILSCDSGNFEAPVHCLAGEMLFQPGGPVAAIAAATESHPLPNYYAGEGMLRALKSGKDRIGDVWLAAERVVRNAHEFLMEMSLKDVEGHLGGGIDVSALKRDSALMYEIFGDPATRLRLPKKLAGTVNRTAKGYECTVKKPAGAVQLVVGLRSGGTFAGDFDPSKPKSAAGALESANALTGFKTVKTLDAKAPWSFTVKGRGELRIAVVTKSGLRVFTTKLE